MAQPRSHRTVGAAPLTGSGGAFGPTCVPAPSTSSHLTLGQGVPQPPGGQSRGQQGHAPAPPQAAERHEAHPSDSSGPHAALREGPPVSHCDLLAGPVSPEPRPPGPTSLAFKPVWATAPLRKGPSCHRGVGPVSSLSWVPLEPVLMSGSGQGTHWAGYF